jgi:hypothetical protein
VIVEVGVAAMGKLVCSDRPDSAKNDHYHLVGHSAYVMYLNYISARRLLIISMLA